MSNESSLEARIADVEADNRRLRRLLDQRDATGELRHRLRSTVAMLRTIIRRSADTKRDLDIYVGHVEDRLDALMRAQSTADENGSVDIYKLLIDELLHYGAIEGPRLSIGGPRVDLQPRAGQVFGLALHELTINAVEHGLLGIGAGQIAVHWEVTADGPDPDPVLTFIWQEIGLSKLQENSRPGFGTEVLTRLLKYELEAETKLQIASDSVVCTIRFPLTERVGHAGGDEVT